MKNAIISKRYARAFFLIAVEDEAAAKYFDELKLFAAVCEKVPETLALLSDWQEDVEKRLNAVDAIAAELKISTATKNFFKLLIEKKRIDAFPLILESYQEFFEELQRISTAKLQVADEASVKQASGQVQDTLAKLLGRDAICDVEVDPSLVGGFVVRVGDTVFDASIKGRLNRMKDALLIS